MNKSDPMNIIPTFSMISEVSSLWYWLKYYSVDEFQNLSDHKALTYFIPM